MLTGDFFTIVIPGLLMLVGIGVAIRAPVTGKWTKASSRVFGILFAAFAASILAISLRQTLTRNACIRELRNLTAEQVTGLRLERHTITRAPDVQAIVRALHSARPYEPNHGNFADKLKLEIATREGHDIHVTVAWSFEKPGAVIWFYSGDPDGSFSSYGYAFCESLPDALEKAGYHLPRFRSGRFMRNLTPDNVRSLRVDGRAVADRKSIAALLDGFQTIRESCSREEVNPSASMDIFLETTDNEGVHIQAILRPERNNVVFWYVSGDRPETAITHGCALGGSGLKKALEDLKAHPAAASQTAPTH